MDLVGPAEITFGTDNLGVIRVGALQGEIDYRVNSEGDMVRVEFSWSGVDDGTEVSGRGWAQVDSGSLTGKLFIHMGDEVTLAAVCAEKPKRA